MSGWVKYSRGDRAYFWDSVSDRYTLEPPSEGIAEEQQESDEDGFREEWEKAEAFDRGELTAAVMPNGAKVAVHTAGAGQPETEARGTQVLILGEQPMTEMLEAGDPLMDAAGFETCIVPTMLGLPLVIKRLPAHKVLTQSLHHPRNRLVAGLMMDPASGEPLPRWESTDCACLVRRSDHEDFGEDDLKPLSHFLESIVRKAFADDGAAQARKQLTPANYAAFRERPAQAVVLGEGGGGPVLSDWDKLADKQQEAALRLGWTQKLWDDNELPEIFISTWDELTTQERDDAKTLGYDREEWEAEYTSSSDDELPMTDADRAVKGARVKLSEQIKTCQARWWAELPDSGAVSLATMHDLQWHEGDLSDGDNGEWDGTGWKPWLQHLDGSEASAEQLKVQGNDAFKSGNLEEAHKLYTAALMKGGSIGDKRERVVAASVRNTEIGRSAALNRAACSLELGMYSETVEDCTLVLGVEPGNPKALFRRGKAHFEIGRMTSQMSSYQSAKQDLLQAAKLQPNNRAVRAALKDCKAALVSCSEGRLSSEKELAKGLAKMISGS